MFEQRAIEYKDKAAFYAKLQGQARALVADEPDRVANAANLAALLFHALPDVIWAGFYFFDGKELVVGPFQGKPACVRIPLGRGVCGAAAQRREALVVGDVTAFADHIVCDVDSRSEVVIPIESKGGELVGVLDIDSASRARFDEDDAIGLRPVAQRLA